LIDGGGEGKGKGLSALLKKTEGHLPLVSRNGGGPQSRDGKEASREQKVKDSLLVEVEE